jgi:hypothetical protein
MQHLPITGDVTYDFVLIVLVVIAGVFMALRADNKWGWALVLLAFLWGFLMLRVMGLV